MTMDNFYPQDDEVEFDDEQAPITEEWALTQELQSLFLPMYIAATDQLASEEYRMVQDMLMIANIVLSLG